MKGHKAAQAERDASLSSLAEERNRLDAALGCIQAQLAPAELSRELRCESGH